LKKHHEWHSGLSHLVSSLEVDEMRIYLALDKATEVVEQFDQVVENFRHL